MIEIGTSVRVKEDAGTLYDGMSGVVVRYSTVGNGYVVKIGDAEAWYSDDALEIVPRGQTKS